MVWNNGCTKGNLTPFSPKTVYQLLDPATPAEHRVAAGAAKPPLRTLEPGGRSEIFAWEFQTVRARPGRLSALSVSRSKSILHGFFVWAHRALNRPKRRFPARAVGDRSTGHRFRLRSAAQRRRLSASAGRIGCRCAWRRRPRHQARKTPSWPRSLANFSRF